MDGIHDMGGKHGWGTVSIDPDEPVFESAWEARAFALGAMSAGLAGTNLDAFRHALERLHPLDYLSDGYYGRWLACAELLLVDSGVVPSGAVEARARRMSGEDVPEPGEVELNKPQYERGGAGSLRTIDVPPAYSVGQRVLAATCTAPATIACPPTSAADVGVVSAHSGRQQCCRTRRRTSPVRSRNTCTR